MTKSVSSHIDTVNQNSQQGYYTHIISDFSCPLRHFVRAFKHTFEQNRLKCNKCSKKWLNVEFRWIGKKRELLSRWWCWWCREWTWFQEPINGNVRVCVCVYGVYIVCSTLETVNWGALKQNARLFHVNVVKVDFEELISFLFRLIWFFCGLKTLDDGTSIS